MMKRMPNDPVICLSYINTQLRDYYADLDELCYDFGTERRELEDKLGGAGYFYNKELNQFR